MSYSTLSDVSTNSGTKSSQSIVSSDCNEQPAQQQQQQQPMETQFEGSAMPFGKMNAFGANGLPNRRISHRASMAAHGRRSATARNRSQKMYKAESCRILTNPYLNFLRDYRLHYGDRYQGQELLQRAASKWKGMTTKQRLLYEPQSYQRGKFTSLVENAAGDKIEWKDTQLDSCRPGVACPPRSPPKRSCRPKMNACHKKKPSCRPARRKLACKPRKKACRRPKKSCRPKKRACRPKKKACRPRKPACRPKPRCKPKKPACHI